MPRGRRNLIKSRSEPRSDSPVENESDGEFVSPETKLKSVEISSESSDVEECTPERRYHLRGEGDEELLTLSKIRPPRRVKKAASGDEEGDFVLPTNLQTPPKAEGKQQKKRRQLKASDESEDNASIEDLRTKHSTYEIKYHDIKFEGMIGEGSFGQVHRGFLWSQEVAVKKIKGESLQANAKDFMQEVEIMKTLRHPNIVEFLGVCVEPSCLCIVTEYLSQGSLEDMLKAQEAKGKKLSMPRIISLAKDIARGLNWLHHKRIIHRDLKPANILLDQNGKGKIADFGLSHMRKRISDVGGFYGLAGTSCYMAPEVLKKEPYGLRADVFSFGLVLCEMVIGKYPYDDDAPTASAEFEAQIVQGLRPEIPAECPKGLKSLIESCWQDDADRRPSVDQILEQLDSLDNQVRAEMSSQILDELPEPVQKLFEEQRQLWEEEKQEVKRQSKQLKQAERTIRSLRAQIARERRAREETERALQRQLEGDGASTSSSAAAGSSASSLPFSPVRTRATRMKLAFAHFAKQKAGSTAASKGGDTAQEDDGERPPPQFSPLKTRGGKVLGVIPPNGGQPQLGVRQLR